MIDFKRVTPGFVFAYLKWALPIVLCAVLFVVCWVYSSGLLAARQEKIDEQISEIARLSNELEATKATAGTSNLDATTDVADPALLASDKATVSAFISTFFNYNSPEAYTETRQILFSTYKFYADPTTNEGKAAEYSSFVSQFPPGGTCALGSWQTWCQAVSGSSSVWFCLVDYTLDGEAHQCVFKLGITGSDVKMSQALVLKTV